MDEKARQTLEEFKTTDHYIISQLAKSIIARMKKFVPAHIDFNHIHYEFFPSATRCFGRAVVKWQDEWVWVRLHPAYRNISIREEMIETLTHEIAHIIAYRWKGKGEFGHGFYWGYIMIAMGYEPARLQNQEKSRAVWAADKLEGLPQFEFTDCDQCGVARMFEINDLKGVYVCTECGQERRI